MATKPMGRRVFRAQRTSVVLQRPFIAPAVNHAFDAFSETLLRRVAALLGLPAVLPGTYRCPFDFLTEFELWFEFHRRKLFAKEPTWIIIGEMLADDDRDPHDYMDTRYSTYSSQVWPEKFEAD